MTKKSAYRGFTLIELTIVVAVVAVLAALIAPTILGQMERARASRARSDVAELASYFARMRVDTGTTNASCLTNSAILVLTSITSAPLTPTYCTPKAITNCNFSSPDGNACWGGPYTASTSFNDAWGQQYQMSLDTNTNAVTVRSNGPDQTPNTSDDITGYPMTQRFAVSDLPERFPNDLIWH